MATTGARQRKAGGPPMTDQSADFKDTGSRSYTVQEDIEPDSGLLMLCKLTLLLLIVLPACVILVLILAVESPIDPVLYSMPDAPKLEGVLAPNDFLVEHGRRLYEGQLRGPESILHHHGHIYTGTADGKILHIEGGLIRTLATLGKPPCGDISDEPNCGRPLGMRFDKDGYLIVLDTYLGMYKVNVATGDAHQLFPATMEVNGRPLRFLNDLDIATDGTIYFTDSSVHQRRNFPLDLLEGKPQGRLLKYNPVDNTTSEVLRELYFSNGVQLSRDESYILVAETTRNRVIKYHLKGDKKGQKETFADNLPGTPDNIRLAASGGYWVAIGICRHADSFSLPDFLSSRPWLRKQLAKIPTKYFMMFVPRCGMLLQLDNEGHVVRSLQDLKGERLQLASEVEDDGGLLYVGSFTSPYIGLVDTRKHVTGGG